MRNRLRELRAVRRWSQADLADVLGVSRQTVNAIETERFDPSLPLAFKIATVFDQTIEAIFLADPDRSERRADRDQRIASSRSSMSSVVVSGLTKQKRNIVSSSCTVGTSSARPDSSASSDQR